MTANRSLDEFADAGAGEDEDPSGAAAAVEPSGAPGSATDGADVTSSPEEEPVPPTSTYAWTPDGGTCAACGETVEARWRDGGELVCEACKSW